MVPFRSPTSHQVDQFVVSRPSGSGLDYFCFAKGGRVSFSLQVFFFFLPPSLEQVRRRDARFAVIGHRWPRVFMHEKQLGDQVCDEGVTTSMPASP